MRYLRPEFLADASSLAREDPWDVKFVSGGTAVVLMLQQGLIAPSVLVSLADLADVRGWTDITEDAGDLRIGGGVSLTRVARSALVRERAPSLAHAASVVGNTRIRNVATLGGNVAEADYASDPPSVLVALGAVIEIGDGVNSRTLPASEIFVDFYTTALEPGEVITGVRVPVARGQSRSTYLKFCSRSAEDRPCVGVAATVRERDGLIESLEVVIGAAAATPQRLNEVTSPLAGSPLTAELAGDVAQEYASRISPLSDARGSAWYRQELIDVLVRRSLGDLMKPGDQHA